VRVIFDYHDPTLQLYQARFLQNGVLYRLVGLAECLTFHSADVLDRDKPVVKANQRSPVGAFHGDAPSSLGPALI
jgi:hypothetical protein